MKVALVYWGCHRRGGVERLVFEAAHYLASRRHAVTVYAVEWESAESPPAGIPITYRRVPIIAKPGILRALSFFTNSTRLVRTAHNEVLNSHGVFCPLGGVHWANSVHRAWLEQSRRLHSRFSARGLRRQLNPQHALTLRQERRHFAGSAARVIAASEQVALDLNRLYGTPRTNINVVNNGFDPNDFNPKRRLARRAMERTRLGIGENETAMLMVANELDRKGLPTLLTAMHTLKRTDVKLIVAGRAPYKAYLQRIDALGLRNQVLFIGSSADVAAYHAAADFFVLPTQYEAFCLAILEALGSGLPVITTSVPGAGDTILHGTNGLLMQDPLNAHDLACHIETLLDVSTRRQMQANASPSVEAFHWNRILERYEQVLAECAAGPH